MIIVDTMQNGGTHSLMKQLDFGSVSEPKDGVVVYHTHMVISPEHADFDIVTTYRDPLRVAASWANRGLSPFRNNFEEMWCRGWLNWKSIRDRATVYPVEDLIYHENSLSDKKGMHAAIENNDMNYFYSIIPKPFIDFARSCVDG